MCMCVCVCVLVAYINVITQPLHHNMLTRCVFCGSLSFTEHLLLSLDQMCVPFRTHKKLLMLSTDMRLSRQLVPRASLEQRMYL